jgi:glyoxylase-like metal-dependent hydrolase (beta-lactamase superfamily II)
MKNLKMETFTVGKFGCNCTILSSATTKEAIIIDPGNDAPTLIKKIQQQELQVKLLLHTHAHFDHIGQSKEIHAKTGAKICLHKEDQFLYDMLEQQGAWFGMKLSSPGKINHYLEHQESFGIQDEGLENLITTLHTPGHTPGSCCFHLNSTSAPVLFSGDTLFKSSIGRTDLPGGDFKTIEKSIKETVYSLAPETVVISGHGPNTLLGVEMRSNPFVKK